MMRVGIRLKIGILLVVAGVIPLGAALGVIVFQERRMQTRVFGQAQQTVATAIARRIESSLRNEIVRVLLALQADPHTHEKWLLLETTEPRSPEELRALDAIWPTLAEDDPRIMELKENPIGEHLIALQKAFPEMAEVFVTDRHGQLVASTGVTEDFYQAGEDWWDQAFNGGRGQAYMSDVALDESAGVWSVDVGLPLYHNGQVVGVAKIVLNISEWLANALLFSEFEAVGGLMAESESLIADARGNIVFYRGPHDPHWDAADVEATAGGGGSGWRLTEEGMLQGYARIPFGERVDGLALVAPEWTVVLQIHRPSLLAHLNPWTWLVTAVGVGIILVIYVLGLFIADRSLGRRIRKLRSVARMVGNGVFTNELRDYRTRHLLGSDEIDELIKAFDQMIENVADSHDELERANELKSSFIKVAGHELRTPISYILTLPKLMERTDDVDRLHEGMRTMEAKARRLSDIIQSMFKLMPEEAFSGHLNRSEVSLTELLEDIHEDVLPFATERHQTVIIEPHHGPLPMLHVDRDKLSDVIQNLLGNAIKFTPDGGEIRVRTSMFADERVGITVIDQGPGIPEADIENIFNPFYSTADVMKHSSGSIGQTKHGMGLGLAVVKHFVELHGGTVSVKSSPHGSEFTITLPIG
jgi:signal transduction histidine kinase